MKKMAPSILMINGPNMNLLGTREPHLYGHTTFAELEKSTIQEAESLGAHLEAFQSNHEGAIVDRIQKARGVADVIIINPAAYTHTSVAIRDALNGVSIPFIEVHVTNTHKREPFRHHSYLTDKAEAFIMGFGVVGYHNAVQYACQFYKERLRN